ncbi:MAG: hypothetical protein JNJ80_15155 [Gemmatimonadetes bacterium]|nr:hypothetical protein [Gemmatimonadota bacterium]
MTTTLTKASGYHGNSMALPVPNLAEVRDGVPWKVFNVVAPDGLCCWFGERQAS